MSSSTLSQLRSHYNHLLSKDEVGISRSTSTRLPPVSFIYGKSAGKDNEDAREVIKSWKFHNPSDTPKPSRDFKQLNKMGVNSGLSLSKEFSTFRKSVDAQLKVRKGQTYLKLSLPEEEFAYGVPNRPSTPMYKVMGHGYGNEALEQVGDQYRQRINQLTAIQSTKSLATPKMTNAMSVRASATNQRMMSLTATTNSNPFKIRKFLNVNPRTETKNTRYIMSKSHRLSMDLTNTQENEGIDVSPSVRFPQPVQRTGSDIQDSALVH